MPRQARVPEDHSPRTTFVLATPDLLRRGDPSGAGSNHVVDTDRAPKGSYSLGGNIVETLSVVDALA